MQSVVSRRMRATHMQPTLPAKMSQLSRGLAKQLQRFHSTRWTRHRTAAARWNRSARPSFGLWAWATTQPTARPRPVIRPVQCVVNSRMSLLPIGCTAQSPPLGEPFDNEDVGKRNRGYGVFSMDFARVYGSVCMTVVRYLPNPASVIRHHVSLKSNAQHN
jgi:hypothetical protein